MIGQGDDAPDHPRDPWSPARPVRAVSTWADTAVQSAVVDEAPPSMATLAMPGRPAAATRRRASWIGHSPARRLLEVTAALALAIALITVVGLAATPDYGDALPWRSGAVADLRAAPTVAGWTTDLRAAFGVAVRSRCETFHASSAVDHTVALWATTATTPSGCVTSAHTNLASTVALLDTTSGKVLWSHRLAADAFGDLDGTGAGAAGGASGASGGIAIAAASVMPSADSLVIEASAAGRFRVVSLDLAAGTLRGFHDLGTTARGVQSTVSASSALLGATGAAAGTTRWQLVDPHRVGRPAWFATLDDSVVPLLVGDAVFVSLGGRSVRVDGDTGRVSTLGQGTVDLQHAVVEGTELFTTQATDSGDVITAWNSRGTRLWISSGTGDIVGATRTCLMTSFAGTATSSCLSRRSGHRRWSAGTGTSSVSLGLPGQTSDSAFVVSVEADGRRLLIVDGVTGAVDGTAGIPPLTFPVLASHSTGYLERRSGSDTVASISAFDLRSGRVLWTLRARPGRTVDLWGGRLVTVSALGVARELTDARTHPLGR